MRIMSLAVPGVMVNVLPAARGTPSRALRSAKPLAVGFGSRLQRLGPPAGRWYCQPRPAVEIAVVSAASDSRNRRIRHVLVSS